MTLETYRVRDWPAKAHELQDALNAEVAEGFRLAHMIYTEAHHVIVVLERVRRSAPIASEADANAMLDPNLEPWTFDAPPPPPS